VKNESKGMLIGLVGVCIFALTLPASKLAVEVFNPAFVSFGRAFIAGLAGLGYILIIKAPIPPWSIVRTMFLIIIGIVICFPYLMTLAMANGSSSHGGIILGFMPLLTTVFGVVRHKERPSRGFWFASLLGTGLVLTYALIQGAGSFSYMDFLLMSATIFSALGYAEGAEISRFMSPKLVISWAVVIALPINATVTYITFEPKYLNAPIMYWESLLFLGLFSMYIGFFFWYEGLSLGGISRVSQVQLTQPFITLICANVLLSEKLEAINFIFAALVVSSVFLGKHMLVKRA
jgi:drug/metabolite transporter (DMT)-like permease